MRRTVYNVLKANLREVEYPVGIIFDPEDRECNMTAESLYCYSTNLGNVYITKTLSDCHDIEKVIDHKEITIPTIAMNIVKSPFDNTAVFEIPSISQREDAVNTPVIIEDNDKKFNFSFRGILILDSNGCLWIVDRDNISALDELPRINEIIFSFGNYLLSADGTLYHFHNQQASEINIVANDVIRAIDLHCSLIYLTRDGRLYFQQSRSQYLEIEINHLKLGRICDIIAWNHLVVILTEDRKLVVLNIGHGSQKVRIIHKLTVPHDNLRLIRTTMTAIYAVSPDNESYCWRQQRSWFFSQEKLKHDTTYAKDNIVGLISVESNVKSSRKV